MAPGDGLPSKVKVNYSGRENGANWPRSVHSLVQRRCSILCCFKFAFKRCGHHYRAPIRRRVTLSACTLHQASERVPVRVKWTTGDGVNVSGQVITEKAHYFDFTDCPVEREMSRLVDDGMDC